MNLLIIAFETGRWGPARLVGPLTSTCPLMTYHCPFFPGLATALMAVPPGSRFAAYSVPAVKKEPQFALSAVVPPGDAWCRMMFGVKLATILVT